MNNPYKIGDTIVTGIPIESIERLIDMARDKQSVGIYRSCSVTVVPAAVVMNWNFALLRTMFLNDAICHTINVNNIIYMPTVKRTKKPSSKKVIKLLPEFAESNFSNIHHVHENKN